MFDHLDRNEYMILRDTRLEEAVRSAITQMDKMADDYLRDYLTARGIILATPEHDAEVAAKALREAAGDVRDFADVLTEQGDHHVSGCEGQADCAACVSRDLRALADRIERETDDE